VLRQYEGTEAPGSSTGPRSPPAPAPSPRRRPRPRCPAICCWPTPITRRPRRAGLLDDPSYLAGLDDDHPLRRNENVFPFSAATAASETLQLLTAVIAPGGVGDVGAQLYHFATGTLDRRTDGCRPNCPYADMLLTLGDTHGFEVAGRHQAATAAREIRHRAGQRWVTRLGRSLDDLLWRLV